LSSFIAALAKGIAMRVFTILAAVLSATVLSAVSQDQSDQPPRTAKAASPFNEFRSAQWVRVEGANGRRFLAAIMRPKGVGPFPAVVVLHGGDGLNTSYLSLASDLARSGFVVVTGCWQAANTVCSEATPLGEWVADPAAHSGKELISLARTLPKVQADRIGLYGLSRGGHAALWAASTGAHVQAVVALTVMTLFVPCVANFLMIVKERGLRIGLAILAFVTLIAVGTGAVLNSVLGVLHVAF